MIRSNQQSACAPRNRITSLASVSALALGLSLPGAALAQEEDLPPEETTEGGTPEAVVSDDNLIIVSGYRASLQSAQAIKENADTFVDVITSEDIGALPDRSVAEALQRVPGVNIGRFENTADPDRFSVEGTGVIIRGLPYVRSELNGRDIFSATGGRELSFNDVSPELLGRVEVFKNVTADMIDGGIAGTVNLVTRKPLDNPGPRIAGTVEATIGDLAEEWSPGFSVLASNTWDGNFGTMGLQFGYAQSELVSRTDASQVTDPCYRADTLDGPCIRALAVNDQGFTGDPIFDGTNFPPAGTVVVPKGAGVRTTRLERDRRAYSGVFEWESVDGNIHMALEYLRAETQFFTDEAAVLSLVNDDALFPVPAEGGTFTFDDRGVFQSGVLTQPNGGGYASPFGGIPTELLRFQRGTDANTQDLSYDLQIEASDRLRFNFEAQWIRSDLERDSIIGAMNTWMNVAVDNSGTTPDVQFIVPPGAPADYLSSGFYTYYWFLLDSVEENDGELLSGRLDAEYDISDEGFFKRARFGARWAERDRTTRNTNFSTWGNLSAPWAGRAGCLPWNQTLAGSGCAFQPGRLYTGLPGQEFAVGGGAFTDEFPTYSQQRNPFDDGFQRGNTAQPLPGAGGYFFGGDDFLGEYLSGESKRQAQEINAFSQTPNPFFGVDGRDGCDPFCEGEISAVIEQTKAAYARVDYGTDFDNGMSLEGNFGVRYVHTKIESAGRIQLPVPDFFDDPGAGGNGDGVVQVAEVNQACLRIAPGQQAPGYCGLTPERLAEFASLYTGEVINDNRDITFDHWLPSFNAKLDFNNGMILRGAVSKNIARPELDLFRAGGGIGDNTNDLRQAGTLNTGPLFQIFTGNRAVRPVESWNYDLSFEYYFDDVGSITVSGFMKDLSGIVSSGVNTVRYVTDAGTQIDVEVNGPSNELSGTLKGVELAYQQTYDFLPGVLAGLGSQLTYTYVDGGDFTTPDLAGNRGLFSESQPLEGISEHTVNAVVFYERGPISARAAYNWRSDFLVTARDAIFPFSPIYQEATGQLDASIFYTVNDNLKLGIQAVNLLDEVTRTSQVVDFDGTRVTRSAFRNDRRYTFLARFEF